METKIKNKGRIILGIAILSILLMLVSCGKKSTGARLMHFFGRDGKHLRSISLARMPSSFFSRPKVDSQDNIVARSMIEEDEDGYQVVKRYKVTWRDLK